MKIGASFNGQGTDFTVWAPFLDSVSVKLVYPEEMVLQMKKSEFGYWNIDNVDAFPGTQYFYHLDNKIDRPDPASQFQPEGVHGPSQIINHMEYKWNDLSWKGIPHEEYIIYELHTGTFTPEGSFDGVEKKLDYLIDLGVTALELMPLAQFPGDRNWGYDGAYPFAVQESYGGPYGLKKLVDICHSRGIAVIVDVVYNHLGPEGTYVLNYGPYFTDRYNTPWGAAVNFDGEWSDGVRNFFIQNAMSWFENYHIDALRLDAVQGIYDFGAKHILQELAESTENLTKDSWKRFLIAESDLDDIRIITPIKENGYGIDAQWSDDFHHALQALLTGEKRSYYADFGNIDQLGKAYRDGFVYSWTYSEKRKRHFGSSSAKVPGKKLVVCLQNHDQIGNRIFGERLSKLVSLDALKLAVGALFITPYIPLLFMGEEFAADTPFLYFISHTDNDLIKAVREGRAREFADLHAGIESPDPQLPDNFYKSKLDWDSIHEGLHKYVNVFYKKMIAIRKNIPALKCLEKENTCVCEFNKEKILTVQRRHGQSSIAAVMNFNDRPTIINCSIINFSGKKIIDTSDEEWAGKGASMPVDIYPENEYRIPAFGFVLYNTI
jgi:maltooligosyltrehalose trehalohydrolase